jgi:hypothetical protein
MSWVPNLASIEITPLCHMKALIDIELVLDANGE